jgi:hypothetical protein
MRALPHDLVPQSPISKHHYLGDENVYVYGWMHVYGGEEIKSDNSRPLLVLVNEFPLEGTI